ncbi:TIM-barrel domain-containing protein [Escherichia coli]
MHNHYAYIYNELVWNVLKDTVGEEESCLVCRSASVGAQKFPVHWGGDCYANYQLIGGKPARWFVYWPFRFWLLEPRYRRL